jgi:2-methylcitrate dehydratase PrpD
LAARGFEGPRHILEAEDGGFLAATSDSPNPDEVARDLGSVWRAEAVCFKPYACCGSNHACIDAALALMREHDVDRKDIRRVIAGVSRVVLLQTGFPYQPTTVLNAQMSLRFNLAIAIVDGTALVGQFTDRRIVDPEVCDVAARVDVEVDPEMDAIYPARYAGTVTLVLNDGRTLRRRVDFSKGMPENRMTPADIDAKFLSLAGAAVGEDAARGVLTDLQSMFAAPDVATVIRRLGNLELVTS